MPEPCTALRVPELPESVADATVVALHGKPGDSVRRDELLVELETDKVVLEVPAPFDGKLVEFTVEEGAVVEADAVLGYLTAASETEDQDDTSDEIPVRPARAFITGSTRPSSSSSATPVLPGRVDSPPTSMMSAPSSSMRRP
jgi:2-oxoglutarate dehydrogenase E2 component (dihydrolipoamide succinyltransferase)